MPVNLGIRAMFLHSVLDVSLESYVFSFIKDVYVWTKSWPWMTYVPSVSNCVSGLLQILFHKIPRYIASVLVQTSLVELISYSFRFILRLVVDILSFIDILNRPEDGADYSPSSSENIPLISWQIVVRKVRITLDWYPEGPIYRP